MKHLKTLVATGAAILALSAPAFAFEAFKGPLGVLQKSDGVTDGYVLIAPQGSKNTYLIDNDGKIIREWVSEYPCFYAELLPNGNMARHARVPEWGPNFGGSGGLIEEFDWDGKKVWEYKIYEPGKEILHHTFEVMPNGNYLLLGWEAKPLEEAVAKGLDVNAPGRMLKPEGLKVGPDQVMGIWPDFIREVDHSGKTVWEFHVWDHVGTGKDQWDINKFCPTIYYNPAMPFTQLPGPDWTHFNGIAYRADTDQICVTSRNLGEVYIIDRKTNKMVYRWGNPANYGAGKAPAGYTDDGDQQLFGPHAPDWTPEGNISILDNGTNRPSGTYTRAVELDPKTGKVVWWWGPSSVAASGGNFYSSFQCGAQKLASGNWMITTSNDGHVVEVNNDKQILWEFVNPVQAGVIYKTANNHGKGGDGIHKALRYGKDWPGFKGRDMKPLAASMPNWVEALKDSAAPMPVKK